MLQQRPDPDRLLKEIQEASAKEQRGKLKVFLGAAAGVGKTYAMLSEAAEQLARGVDVVIGYIETHKRADIEALSHGIETLPLGGTDYKGVKVTEFDIDGALVRHPRLILVDELAHTNPPDSRHPKRWQDIEELLHAGIDVYTAVNVQHLESLNDVVTQITGVIVRETVPDAFIERADDIEVVDIPPEELIQRLQEGKVYVPDRIEHALEGFFRKGNLIALRELALRRAADRVDAQMDEMVRRSGEVNVHVITAFEDQSEGGKVTKPMEAGSASGYAAATGITAFITLICVLLYDRIERSNLVMLYLLGVALVASRFGPREAILTIVLSVSAFDLLFVPPRGTFAVADTQYLITFSVMLVVGLLISTLTLRLRRQAESSAERERRTAALYTLSKELAKSRSKREIAKVAAGEIRQVFDADAAVLLADPTLDAIASSDSGFERDPSEAAVASWCYQHNQTAGNGTDTLSGSRGYYLPLRGSSGALGVIGILPKAIAWPMPSAQLNLLETFANGLGLAMERAMLAKESHEARIQAESERIRNALLRSISHDLRTPLTSIAGAASSLRDGQGDSKQLADTIYQESIRLNLQVQNLLDMTRLQSGDVQLSLGWQSLEEIVGTALERTADLLHGRPVDVKMPENIPLIFVDGQLFEKVVANLLENVVAHTPEGSPLEISARAGITYILLDVADRGPGIPKGQETKIFERFFRREDRQEGKGFGLGLAICRTVMRLHAGQIWAENRRDGKGAVFHVEIPKREPPEVPRG